jgi:hypothetical protein
VRDHLAARPLDDDLAEVQHRDPLREVERHVHVVSVTLRSRVSPGKSVTIWSVRAMPR